MGKQRNHTAALLSPPANTLSIQQHWPPRNPCGNLLLAKCPLCRHAPVVLCLEMLHHQACAPDREPNNVLHTWFCCLLGVLVVWLPGRVRAPLHPCITERPRNIIVISPPMCCWAPPLPCLHSVLREGGGLSTHTWGVMLHVSSSVLVPSTFCTKHVSAHMVSMCD